MLVIRELTPQDDFDEIGRIYAESWKSAYRGIVSDRYLQKLTHDRWSGVLRAEPAASLVALLNGKPIGTSMVAFDREPGREGCGEITSIYLLPEYCKHGHGKALMLATLQRLWDEGCVDAYLWALAQNVRAEGFYEHMGFERTGRKQREQLGGEALEVVEYHLHRPIR